MRNRLCWILPAGTALLLCSCDYQRIAPCGDGIVNGTEECDDGNWTADDGCSETCRFETGWECTIEPTVCVAICGDGLRVGPEECDDANAEDRDACSNACRSARCGDGVTQSLTGETCDDGNTDDGDGCSADCRSDETCGNGVRDAQVGEFCDDGNAECGDGCESSCLLTPTPVLGTEHEVEGFALDDTHLYWTDGSILRRRLLAGGEPEELASDISRFVLGDTHVYGVTLRLYQLFGPWDATFISLPKAGGTPTILLSTQSYVTDLEVTATHVCFLDRDEEGGVFTLALTDGALAEIVPHGDGPNEIEVDQDHLFWFGGDPDARTLTRTPLDGGPNTVLADDLGRSRALAQDPDHVYWAQGGEVSRIYKAGGTPELLTAVPYTVKLIALDDAALYLYGKGDPTPNHYAMSTAPKSGGPAIRMHTALTGSPRGLVLSDTEVYFHRCGLFVGGPPWAAVCSFPKYQH